MVILPPRPFREDFDQIRADIRRAIALIPRKSAYQEELESLRDTILKNEEAIRAHQDAIDRLLSLSDKLLQYIDNIEEVKSAGGVGTFTDCGFDLREPVKFRTKLITIPEVKILVVEKED